MSLLLSENQIKLFEQQLNKKDGKPQNTAQIEHTLTINSKQIKNISILSMTKNIDLIFDKETGKLLYITYNKNPNLYNDNDKNILEVPIPDEIKNLNRCDIMFKSTTLIGSIICVKSSKLFACEEEPTALSFILFEKIDDCDNFDIKLIPNLQFNGMYIKESDFIDVVFSNMNTFWIIIKDDNEEEHLIYYYKPLTAHLDLKKVNYNYLYDSIIITDYKLICSMWTFYDITPSVIYLLVHDANYNVSILHYSVLTIDSVIPTIPNLPKIVLYAKDKRLSGCGKYLCYCVNYNISMFSILLELENGVKTFYTGIISFIDGLKQVKSQLTLDLSASFYTFPKEITIEEAHFMMFSIMEKTEKSIKQQNFEEYKQEIETQKQITYSKQKKEDDKKKEAEELINKKAKEAELIAESLIKEEEAELKKQKNKKQKQIQIKNKREIQLQLEKERLQKEKLKKERLIEEERLEKESLLEEERIEKERIENERLVEEERIENERLLEEERIENERLLEEERSVNERLVEERLVEVKRLETIKVLKKKQNENTRLEKKRLVEIKRLEKKRLVDIKRFEKECLEKECLEKERLEKERLEKERLEKERLEKERLEKERLEKERLEKERLEKERLEKERLEKERLEKERLEKEKSLEEKRLLQQIKLLEEALLKKEQNNEVISNYYISNRIERTNTKYTIFYSFIYHLSMINANLANEITYLTSETNYMELMYKNRLTVMSVLDILVINNIHILSIKKKLDVNKVNGYSISALYGSLLPIIYSMILNEIGYYSTPFIKHHEPLKMIDVDTMIVKLLDDFIETHTQSEYIKEPSVIIDYYTDEKPITRTKIQTSSIHNLICNCWDLNYTSALLLYENEKEPYIIRHPDFTDFIFGIQPIQLLFGKTKKSLFNYDITMKRLEKIKHKWY